MGKFWNKNKTAISGTLLAIIGIAGFVGLGYYYSRSDVGYDYVGVGAQVDSLNYNTGSGNQFRITTIMNEGLITPTVDYGTLQEDVATALTNPTDPAKGIQNSITDNNLTSTEEYFIASKVVLAELAADYLGDRTKFDELNQNEQTLVILASSDYEQVDSESIPNGENLTYAARILTHGRPITYIGDDAGEFGYDGDGKTGEEETDWAEWDPTPESGNIFSPYAYGVADTIYVNKDYDQFRFRMRDGSLINPDKETYQGGVATWQEWNDDGEERLDRVSASDVAFGISRLATSMYASSGAYMYSSVSHLVGAGNITTNDVLYGITDEGRYNVGDANTDAERAIYYALAPDTTLREAAFQEDEDFVEFGSQDKNTGVQYHDPKGHENSAVEFGADDYSYIDFSLTEGNTKFATTMTSTGFWPINWEWFIEKVWHGRVSDESGIDAMNTFGTSADTILSNGAQKVTKFDNLYGYTTVKNEDYFDADLVTAEKTSYRMVTEASTQVAMFSNGDATYITGADSNTKVINDDPDAVKWLPNKLTKPATKFMFFNLGTDRLEGSDMVRENAKYTSDPNFRRAFTYAFDTNVYHQLSSNNTANAVSTFEPLGMYDPYGDGVDFVDHMTYTTFETTGLQEQGKTEKLEYYGEEDRRNVVENPIDFSTAVDETQNYDLADYYFEIFLDDMNQLGVALPTADTDGDGLKEFNLKYLTSIGANDPFIKTIQQEIETHEYPGGYEIKVTIEQVASGVFFPYYYAADYDIASIQWGADYLDAWSNIGIFNISENSRGGNSLGGWNIWDGSDYTFDETVYGENTELARELFNDGIVQFYENGGANANITNVEYDNGTNTFTKEDFIGVGKQLWEATLADNGLTYSEGVSLGDTNILPVEGDTTTHNGLNYYAHTEDIWSDPDTALIANLIFELILKDGAATVTGTTESGSISPTRALLEGDPVIGYESRTFSFDLTKSKGFWKDVEKELNDEFFIN